MDKAIFLDFDGVLFDTLKEAYILCRYVCCKTDVFTPIEKNIYERFYKYKFLVFNSWQYLYLFKSINESNIIESFNKFIKNRDLKAENEFERNFLLKRQWLIKNHPDYVDKLEQKFPFLDMMRKLDNKFDIIIVSRKNSFAIKRKIKDWNVKIIGKEELSNVINKSEFIEKYMIDSKIREAFFVDDNSNNLSHCKNINNLTCILAGWGNIGIGENGLSQEDTFNKIITSSI